MYGGVYYTADGPPRAPTSRNAQTLGPHGRCAIVLHGQLKHDHTLDLDTRSIWHKTHTTRNYTQQHTHTPDSTALMPILLCHYVVLNIAGAGGCPSCVRVFEELIGKEPVGSTSQKT